ncbi:MAG: dihydropteroate synthase [Actinomycetota bacterium]
MSTDRVRWVVAGDEIALDTGVLIGILNVTPDSFSDGGEHADPEDAVAHGLSLVADGAAIVDVGAESTRPGAKPVELDEELRRLMPVVDGLVDAGVAVSVDTYKPEVATRALEAGAAVVNDVTGFRNPQMVETVAATECGVIVMHMLGRPIDMQVDPSYDDVVAEVEDYLLARTDLLARSGVSRDRIAIDPGIGFGKRMHHNLALLAALDRLASHGLPVMIGTSRKSFLGKMIAGDSREGRDRATAITTAMGFASGARLFRVHDVAKSRDALRIAGAIVTGQEWDEWSQG